MAGNNKKQLYKGKCKTCGGPVTISSPDKETDCHKCRGWKTKKKAVDKPKQIVKPASEAPSELSVLQKILKVLKFREKVSEKPNETVKKL